DRRTELAPAEEGGADGDAEPAGQRGQDDQDPLGGVVVMDRPGVARQRAGRRGDLLVKRQVEHVAEGQRVQDRQQEHDPCDGDGERWSRHARTSRAGSDGERVGLARYATLSIPRASAARRRPAEPRPCASDLRSVDVSIYDLKPDLLIAAVDQTARAVLPPRAGPDVPGARRAPAVLRLAERLYAVSGDTWREALA